MPSAGANGSPITLDAYDIGDKPKILGSDVITGWTLVSCNSIYTSGVSNIVRIVYYKGAKLTHNNGATTGVGFNEWDWASGALYVNVGESPDTGILEAGNRRICVDANNNGYITIRNLHCGHANTDWQAAIFCYQGADGWVVQNCDVVGSGHAGIWVKQSANAEVSGCTITETDDNALEVSSAVGTTGLNIFSNTITAVQDGIRIFDYNTVKVYDNTITSSQAYGISWEANTQAAIDDCLIHDNIITTVGISVAASGVQTGGAARKTITGAQVYQNTITGVTQVGADGYGIDLDKSTSGALVFRNRIDDCDGAGIGVIASSGNSIYENIITNVGQKGTISRAGLLSGSTGTTSTFDNNVVRDCYHGVRCVNTSTGHTFKTNIIENSDSYHVFFDSGSPATLDYNSYFPDTTGSAGKFAWNGVDSVDFADWQNNSGQDVNSKVAPERVLRILLSWGLL